MNLIITSRRDVTGMMGSKGIPPLLKFLKHFSGWWMKIFHPD